MSCLYAEHALANITVLVRNVQHEREATFTLPTANRWAKVPPWGSYLGEEIRNIKSKQAVLSALNRALRGSVRASSRQPVSPKTSPSVPKTASGVVPSSMKTLKKKEREKINKMCEISERGCITTRSTWHLGHPSETPGKNTHYCSSLVGGFCTKPKRPHPPPPLLRAQNRSWLLYASKTT